MTSASRRRLERFVRYFDDITGTYRFKTRYIWAFRGYLIGMVAGWLIVQLV